MPQEFKTLIEKTLDETCNEQEKTWGYLFVGGAEIGYKQGYAEGLKAMLKIMELTDKPKEIK